MPVLQCNQMDICKSDVCRRIKVMKAERRLMEWSSFKNKNCEGAFSEYAWCSF